MEALCGSGEEVPGGCEERRAHRRPSSAVDCAGWKRRRRKEARIARASGGVRGISTDLVRSGRVGKMCGCRVPVGSGLPVTKASALVCAMILCCVGRALGNDVYVVGYNDYGQLGLGDYLERSTQTLMREMPVETTNAVAAGLYHNLVVGETDGNRGTMYTWGRNTKGQLGHGNVQSIKVPKQVMWQTCEEPNSWVCSPSLCKDVCDKSKCAGYGHENPYFKESDMHCMKPQDRVWGDTPYPSIVDVGAGEDSSYALTEEGRIFSWGSNDWGQLGISDFQEEPLQRPDGKYLRDVPQLLRSVLSQRFIQLSAGTFHCVALDDMGQAWVWGANAEGQLGTGDVAQRSQPAVVQYLGGKNVVRVAAGAYHTLFLTDAGQLFSAGLNTNGQLGHGDDVARSLPAQILALRYANISNVACGAYSSYAVTDSGGVYSWGSNAFGQLGLGPLAATSVATPSYIKWFSDKEAVIYELFGGQRTVFAIDQSGHVFAMGNNEFGMLGVGDETTRNVPAQLADLVGKNVYRIAAGAYHTLSITGCLNLVSPCSGHGKCDEIDKCKCDTGYRGPICADECPGGVGNACSLHGDCIIPKGSKPYCICYAGYSGADCSFECPGGALNPCTGQGECLADGTCACDSGWSGRNCSDRCPGSKSSPCSDLGVCLDGTCQCYQGFTGLNCSTECSGGAYMPCLFRGDCQLDGSCKCYKGYRLADCSCECPGGADYICHERGHCNEACQCECRLGFRGQNCSIDCPGGLRSYLNGFPVIFRVCGGHGECDRQGVCQCVAGYKGAGCEEEPADLGPALLVFIAFSVTVCLGCSAYIYYLRRKMRFSERERKRKARKKLRGGGKGKKKGGKDKKRDRSKKKGKINA